MRVLVSVLINLLIGSSLVDGMVCKSSLQLTGFQDGALNGEWPQFFKKNGDPVTRDGAFVYRKQRRFMFRFEENGKRYWAIGPTIGKYREERVMMRRRGRKSGVTCRDCAFKRKVIKGWVPVPGDLTVDCSGKEKLMMARAETDASAMMEADAVTEQSASGLSSADFMMMAAGAAIGGLLVAVAVAVVVAMRKRKSAKRTEMEMTEAVHVPDSSVMTPDATEKKAEGDEEAVTVHSSHAAEVTVSVSMDDEAVQVDA